MRSRARAAGDERHERLGLQSQRPAAVPRCRPRTRDVQPPFRAADVLGLRQRLQVSVQFGKGVGARPSAGASCSRIAFQSAAGDWGRDKVHGRPIPALRRNCTDWTSPRSTRPFGTDRLAAADQLRRRRGGQSGAGNRCVPPQPGIRPNLTSGRPSLVLGVRPRQAGKSQASATSKPPAPDRAPVDDSHRRERQRFQDAQHVHAPRRKQRPVLGAGSVGQAMRPSSRRSAPGQETGPGLPLRMMRPREGRPARLTSANAAANSSPDRAAQGVDPAAGLVDRQSAHAVVSGRPDAPFGFAGSVTSNPPEGTTGPATLSLSVPASPGGRNPAVAVGLSRKAPGVVRWASATKSGRAPSRTRSPCRRPCRSAVSPVCSPGSPLIGCGGDVSTSRKIIWGRKGVMPGDLSRPRAHRPSTPRIGLYIVDFTARIQVLRRPMVITWATTWKTPRLQQRPAERV